MTIPVETIPEPVVLALTDRCDACGAAAKAQAVKLYNGAESAAVAPLLFCGHHSAEHGPAMMAQGWTLS